MYFTLKISKFWRILAFTWNEDTSGGLKDYLEYVADDILIYQRLHVSGNDYAVQAKQIILMWEVHL